MTEGTENTGESAPVHAFVHTPGPWVFLPKYDSFDNVFTASRPHRRIASVFGTGEIVDCRTANARLIAAAPDLLQACKAALAAIRSACQDGSIIWLDPPFVLPGVHESAAERLQNVIEQAESVV